MSSWSDNQRIGFHIMCRRSLGTPNTVQRRAADREKTNQRTVIKKRGTEGKRNHLCGRRNHLSSRTPDHRRHLRQSPCWISTQRSPWIGPSPEPSGSCMKQVKPLPRLPGAQREEIKGQEKEDGPDNGGGGAAKEERGGRPLRCGVKKKHRGELGGEDHALYN